MVTRYILDFVPIHNTFDLGFKRLDKDSLMATFQQSSKQSFGAVGPHNKRIWGFKLRGDGVLRENPLNEPLIYTAWDSSFEPRDTRIYTFDSDTDSSHPFVKTYFVTNGNIKTPCNIPKESEGRWSCRLFGNNRKRKDLNPMPIVELEGKNEKKSDGFTNEEVVGTLKTVRVHAPMLLVAIEEKKKDRFVGGVKYLIMDGGQYFLRRRRNCVIS